MERWLEDDGPNGWARCGCTALLCHNDDTAIGAMQVLNEAGLKVPSDVSAVGFDGIKMWADPNAVGHRMQFYSPALQEASLVKIRTYTSTWDAQGLAGVRTGAVCYRHHFQVAAADKGKPIGLFLGGFEDEARVWINGKLIGTSGQRFSMPAEFDLTAGIDYTGDNVLAIEVVRNSAANEIGLGGLLRPSFLFTGPRRRQCRWNCARCCRAETWAKSRSRAAA